jgi:hypothetical protein
MEDDIETNQTKEKGIIWGMFYYELQILPNVVTQL